MSTPAGTIHLFLSCTDRKTEVPTVSAQQLSHGTLETRIGYWTRRLDECASERVRAESLYSGDHWFVVRSLPSSAPANIAVRVWICSAGYGLIELDTLICPYAATFSAAHPDAVAPTGSGYSTAEWWSAASKWSPIGTRQRSIAAVAKETVTSNDFVIVALSAAYLSAVRDDLAEAARVLEGRWAVLSAGTRDEITAGERALPVSIVHHLIPTSARLRGVVGGAMQSLNARIARRAVAEASTWFPKIDRLSERVRHWMTHAPEVEVFNRTRMDDQAVRQFIVSALKDHPGATHTTLLRTLRSSGRACEQARFRELFRAVKSELSSASALPSKEVLQ